MFEHEIDCYGIACFYVEMNYDFEMVAVYSSMNVGLRTLDWRWMEECLIRDIVGYSNLFLSDRGLGVAHPFVFNGHVGVTCCSHHVCS